jgi:hypothetical protein
MSQDRRLNHLERVFGASNGPTPGQRAILDWLAIWRLTPQKCAYLQQHAPHMIDLAEPLQDILEDPTAFLAELEAHGITTLEGFLNHLHSQARQ